MAEIKDPKKEYDGAHGAPKGWEPKENDTASTAMPQSQKPLPFRKTGGTV
jgi:hypothetical protein